MELNLTQQILLWVFGATFVMGAVVNKTNFCTMGAISDWVNMGHTGRFRAWLLAIAVAIAGVLLLEGLGIASVDATFPPYRSAEFPWLRFLLGGLMFGVGMTLASGCGNKTLIRIGGGNLKSLVVFTIIAICAYYMANPLHAGTDQTLYSLLFHRAVSATSVTLGSGQDLGAIAAAITDAEDVNAVRGWVGGALVAALLVYVLRSPHFRGEFSNVLGGLVVGGAVVAVWYLTGGELGAAWKDEVAWLDEPPIDVATQSLTFINPMGESFAWLRDPQWRLVSVGVVSLVGVTLGSLAWALVSRGFRIEWFHSWRDFLNHAVGAVLMGIGGVLAMGCTIGQGVTGLSTLALGSLLAFAAIVLGCAVTMKVIYYRMLYEAEATLLKSVITALVDFRLLPEALRKLEAM